jgi:ribulose-phosphate 3-epimerase
MTRISGSLWSVAADEQAKKLDAAVSGGLPVVHWDTSDGVFAARGGFSPEGAARLLEAAPPVESEAHLMVAHPDEAIDAWAELCTIVVVPLETETAARALDKVAARGVQPAVAVSLETPLAEVPADLPVLLMAITPGQAGAPFDSRVLPRISELRARGRNPLIGVDGGVEPVQFERLANSGANWIVSGNSLFAATDPAAWLARCRRSFAVATDESGLSGR